MTRLRASVLLGVPAAALAVVVALRVAIPATADAPTATATFAKSSDWGAGFVGEYTITNTGTDTLVDWTLEFDLAAGQSITGIWNAELRSSGAHQVVTPQAWTRSVAPGGSVRVGFQAAGSGQPGSSPAPQNCRINGQPCDGSPTTSGTATTTTATPAPAAGTSTTSTAAPSRSAARPLTATFTTTSDWGSGFVGQYAISNAGEVAVHGWTLEFDLAAGQSITGVWNATLASSGAHHVVTPAAWTATIQPGATVKVGLQGTSAGPFPGPLNCRIDGAPCAGGGAPPEATTTTTTAPTTTTSAATTTSAPTAGQGGATGSGGTTGGSGATAAGFVPYVDMTLSSDSLAAMLAASGVRRFTLGFVVSGAPCQASWGGYYVLDDPTIARRIADLRAAGGGAVVSFGGVANQELARTCSTVDALAAQYQAVVDRYDIRDLDFDIEGADQTDSASLTRRFDAVARLQAAGLAAGRPVRVSLTLPVMPSGLTDAGLGVVRAAIAHGVDVGAVNVMAMDYFDPALAPYGGHMGDYAVRAAGATQAQLSGLFPGRSGADVWRMVGVTPMLGINDDPAEVFTTADAATLTTFARQHGLGRLSMWSVNRDRPCGRPTTTTENTCSGVADPAWAFSKTFLAFGS